MSDFNLRPYIELQTPHTVVESWPAVMDAIEGRLGTMRPVFIECYHGVLVDDILERLAERFPDIPVFDTRSCMFSEEHIRAMVQPDVTDDRVFGRITNLTLTDFFDPAKVKLLNRRMSHGTSQGTSHGTSHGTSTAILIGPGARLICDLDGTLIYADMARWEIQQRQRAKMVDNLGVSNKGEEDWMPLYKQGYFVDWRVLDAYKKTLFDRIDFLLDTNRHDAPKLVDYKAILEAYDVAVSRPFSLAPFFDPGPWGGHWMKSKFGLPENGSNYAWCFNCVPEENSLLVRIGESVIEIPSINLVFRHPEKLLGTDVYEQFGAEFPIRFDYLDTIGGGNLSLQVHPTKSYIREQFNMTYTQDESYYLMDAEEGACVYLGFKDGVDAASCLRDLQDAERGGEPFDANHHVETWAVSRHDHVLIPAGTIHASGQGCMVLEISATPYIFTFKLWDWGRLGLDGRPRPIHFGHGREVLDWSRTSNWVRDNLVGQVKRVDAGPGWTEERTGLHSSQFIETRRHWFTEPVLHKTGGTVNVLAVVEGEYVIVESPEAAFPPFRVNYGEVFVVPAAVEAFFVRPGESDASVSPSQTRHATLKAYVRDAFKHL